MKRIIIILLLFLSVVCEGESNNNLLTNNDQREIKRIASEYIELYSNYEERKKLRNYESEEIWTTGGEDFILYALDKYDITKIDTIKLDESQTNVIARVHIKFFIKATINKKKITYKKKSFNSILGFARENNKWIVKSIYSEIILTSKGFNNYVKKFPDLEFQLGPIIKKSW